MKTRWKLALCIGIATIAGCGMMAGGGACDPAIGGLPSINSVTPLSGYAGTLVTISGSGFGEEWEDNHVMIGTVAAQVVTASPTQLEALVGIGAKSGAVSVEVNGGTDSIADNFEILDWPDPDSGEDGPPIFYEGHGLGLPLGSAKNKELAAANKLPSTGQLQVLVDPVVSHRSSTGKSRERETVHRRPMDRCEHLLQPGQLRRARCTDHCG